MPTAPNLGIHGAAGTLHNTMTGSTFIDELTTFQHKLDVPAVIGAVTDADGLIDIAVVGTRSRTDPTPATTADQWHLGSCGKSITAMLYARLVELGLTEWGRPIADLFPDIVANASAWATPTIDDLLHCRAGVPANPTTKAMLAAHKSTKPVVEQRTEAVQRVLRSDPSNPGDSAYSNLGYAMVGAAIDRIVDGSYETALYEHVLEPLGITTAGFGPPNDFSPIRSRIAKIGRCRWAGRVERGSARVTPCKGQTRCGQRRH